MGVKARLGALAVFVCVVAVEQISASARTPFVKEEAGFVPLGLLGVFLACMCTDSQTGSAGYCKVNKCGVWCLCSLPVAVSSRFMICHP